MVPLFALSATALAQAFAQGGLSPVEVTQSVIDHIARCEPQVQALYAYAPEAALAQARASEARWRRGDRVRRIRSA